MSAPVVTIATGAQFPNLDRDEQGLPDALRARGIEPRIAVWDDPSVNWDDAGVVVVRSVRDYARDRKKFVNWARSVPRILNSAETIAWNTDKHYLRELAARGLPTIPTIWLEADRHYTKQQIHSRFPATGDFVVKPAVSSGGRGTGRYTATDPKSRAEAIEHAMRELRHGRTVMVQRYLDVIDRQGETSLIYLNGLSAYQVEKAPMLHPCFRSTADSAVVDEVVNLADASEETWRWGERIRKALHGYVKEKSGHDELLLFNRVDIVRGDEDSEEEFYVMEISLIDGSLYLSAKEENLNRFADAIQTRVMW
ncbi:RimK family alpha-L-glutamate ligase [Arcanobacterium sp. S3PF19]|uniref:ATP-grasp domain-containing protein n=1 Tax=Arcanobacterium sp. S3PF19 TaxID=1219585 RepID=UPI0005105BD0|nr:glutathione synthetase [Arcanobacterium sp. S3PF19]KGF05539.1 glutathione synthetase [Arcanobacterium sp. S3PF19]